MNRIEELTAMIRAGWSDMPGDQIPSDWRTRAPNVEEQVVILEYWGIEYDATSFFVLENERARRTDMARKAAYARSAKRKTAYVPLERKCAEMRERMRAQRKSA